MECNVTFTKKKRAAAFTLIEYMVVAGISGVVLLALTQLSFFTVRSFAALYNYIELDKYSRNALDQMVYKIRQADSLTTNTPTRLVFAYNGTNTLTYNYARDQKILTEQIGTGTPKVLLRGCDLLNFSIYQRNTAAGTYDQFPAFSGTNTAKLIQLSWSCSRSALGARINTESVQSAKIVIRNP